MSYRFPHAVICPNLLHFSGSFATFIVNTFHKPHPYDMAEGGNQPVASAMSVAEYDPQPTASTATATPSTPRRKSAAQRLTKADLYEGITERWTDWYWVIPVITLLPYLLSRLHYTLPTPRPSQYAPGSSRSTLTAVVTLRTCPSLPRTSL
jgi:hypothetical protein